MIFFFFSPQGAGWLTGIWGMRPTCCTFFEVRTIRTYVGRTLNAWLSTSPGICLVWLLIRAILAFVVNPPPLPISLCLIPYLHFMLITTFILCFSRGFFSCPLSSFGFFFWQCRTFCIVPLTTPWYLMTVSLHLWHMHMVQVCLSHLTFVI